VGFHKAVVRPPHHNILTHVAVQEPPVGKFLLVFGSLAALVALCATECAKQ